MCSTLHVLLSLLYIACGSIQLVVGIFFLVAKEAPFFRLGTNVLSGGWNVVVGVAGALTACVGSMSSPGRHEALLYMSVSVLAMNAVNLAILEIVEWHFLTKESDLENARQKDKLDFLLYARTSATVTCLVAMLFSFLDAQITFCSLQRAERKKVARRRSAKGHHLPMHAGHHALHDHSVDSEYIILPRVRPSTKGGYEQYTRSWVFDVDGNGPAGAGRDPARYQQLDGHGHGAPDKQGGGRDGAAPGSSRSSTARGDTYTVADAKAIRAAIANGGPPPDPGSSPSPGMGPGGPGGSKQFSRQQKHKELMREREEQKQQREHQQFQHRQKQQLQQQQQRQQHEQRQQQHQQSRPGSTASAASSSRHSSSHQQGQRDVKKSEPAIEESPPSGTSPDSPAVDSEESRSPDSGDPVEQDGWRSQRSDGLGLRRGLAGAGARFGARRFGSRFGDRFGGRFVFLASSPDEDGLRTTIV